MTHRLFDHLLGVAVVAVVFVGLASLARDSARQAPLSQRSELAPYLGLQGVDFGDPLHRAIFRESVAAFHPEDPALADSLLQQIDAARQEEFTTASLKAGAAQPGITLAKLNRLAPMYLRFVAVYVVVLILTTYGARAAGIYRFVRMKQRRLPAVAEFALRLTVPGASPAQRLSALPHLLRALANGLAYVVLFSPAYVIAYAMKTSVDTGSTLFMILLAVGSNGLLVNYANTFTTFLVHESQKGYVETAVVKSLHSSYAWGTPDGIPRRALFRPALAFPSHVFQHIYMNAAYQYIPAMKEQAAFLITGLVIIEMALNIQGHLCYELLQTILYRDYEVVALIILAIFVVVKATDIVVDSWWVHASNRYRNKAQQ